MEPVPSTSTQKIIYTKVSKTAPLRLTAPPFIHSQNPESADFDYPVCVGQTQVPVNSRIWSSIAASPQPFLKSMIKKSEMPSTQTHSMDNSRMCHPGGDGFQQHIEKAIEYPMTSYFGPIPTPDGMIEFLLRDNIKVLITIDRGVLIRNQNNNIRIAMSHNFSGTALDHPNGRVLQQLQRISAVAHDGMNRNRYVRYVKMWHKGISLTSEGCALIYLVDAAGTRTTSDVIMMDDRMDYCTQVFMSGSRVGSEFYPNAVEMIQNYRFWIQEDGTENFEINGMRVTQTQDGMVKVSRSNNRCAIRTSPGNGNATISTPYYHCTASLGNTSHLFVRCEERRMHFDGTALVVRNAGHSAGFDDRNRLKVY